MLWGISKKKWMLELSNLCHCVQHPWKLTSRDFWSSRNASKPLSKLKHVFRKCSKVSQKNSECGSFQTCAIVFSTPENWLVGISGALGMKVSHFLSKNVFWENAVGYLKKKKKKQWMLELSNLCHCVQHSWKVTSRDFWSSRNERKTLSKQNVFWENAVGYFKKQWMLKLSNLCHCVQHSWKVTSRDFWSSRNESKPLSKQKCVLRKCCGVFQKTVNAKAFKPLPLCSALLKSY